MQQPDLVGVGIIGTGSRGANCLGRRMAELAGETGLRITALCDRHPDRLREARDALVAACAEQGVAISPALHDDPASLAADAGVDLVVVTTPQCAHRAPAVAGLEAGRRVYVDKPIAHTLEDARAIVQAEARAGRPVMMGFTRRYEAPWRRAFELLMEGAIGELHMILIRDIIPFHVFFHTWHRRREWSGDALNDKSSHHLDVFNWFAQSRAVKLSAFGGRRVFVADPDAPARCCECGRECPYRVGPTRGVRRSQEEMTYDGESRLRAETEFERADNCVYLPGADSLDHATIQVAYESGVVASLIVAFFGPRSEDQETMELVGTTGRILLNRHRGSLDVIRDYGGVHEVLDCRTAEFGSSHFGADLELVREMRRFADGEPPPVSARDGYEATRMVMAALTAIDRGGGTIALEELPDAGV